VLKNTLLRFLLFLSFEKEIEDWVDYQLQFAGLTSK
jgi:hypothetical protein